MAAIIGALRVVLGADTGSFEDGLKRASGSLNSFSRDVAAIATGVQLSKIFDKLVEAIGAVATATFHSIDAMDKMGKEAQKLGFGVEELSKLSVAARLSDVDLTELSKSVVQLSKRMVDGADNGAAPARRALTALGLSAKEFIALKPEKQMEVLADRFSKFRDGADKTAAAVALFGRAGAALIPLLNEGSEGFRKASELAVKLGLVMSGEASQAAQKFNDNMKLVALALTQGISNIIAEKVLPALISFSEGLLSLTISFLGFLGASDKLKATLEELKQKLRMPTDEEARKAQQFTDRIDALRIRTKELAGGYPTLAKGLAETAVQMKLVNAEFFTQGQAVTVLPQKVRELNDAMLAFRGQQITQENLDQWEVFRLKMAELELQFGKNTISAETFNRAATKAAVDLNSIYTTAAAGIAGSIGEMFTSIGGDAKNWAQAAKIAAAAQALINSYQAATMAYAQLGPIAGTAAAIAVLAKGLALVAAIKGTPIGFAMGGGFKVGGAGGMDSQMVNFMATPGERVTVEPSGRDFGGRGGRAREVAITLRGKSFGFEDIRDLFEQLNSGMRDGYRLKVVQ